MRTLAQLRAEAVRAFGEGAEANESRYDDWCFVITPPAWKGGKICVWGASRMNARRLALELLFSLADTELAR